LRETALRLPGFKRNTIEEKFVVGDAEYEAAIAGFRQSLLQFVPRRLKLTLRPLMIGSVESRILDKDV